MNNEYIVLTDGSSHALSNVGYGAALLVSAGDLAQPLEKLKKQVRVKRFEQTSSTKLELQILLWALGQFPESPCRVTIYTDSQNIVGLLKRRQRLTKRGFKSSTGKRLNNADLYRRLYQLADHFNCTFVKMVGHQPALTKGRIDRLFSLVDRAARKSLRNSLKELSPEQRL